MNTITQQIKIIILGLAVAFGLSYAFAWTGPSSTPPNGNVAAPLNVGSSPQIKLGSLVVNGSTTATYTDGLTTFGLSQFYGNSIFDGHIQISDGTQGSGKILSSDGSGNASWVSTSTLGVSGGGATKNVYLCPVMQSSVSGGGCNEVLIYSGCQGQYSSASSCSYVQRNGAYSCSTGSSVSGTEACTPTTI